MRPRMRPWCCFVIRITATVSRLSRRLTQPTTTWPPPSVWSRLSQPSNRGEARLGYKFGYARSSHVPRPTDLRSTLAVTCPLESIITSVGGWTGPPPSPAALPFRSYEFLAKEGWRTGPSAVAPNGGLIEALSLLSSMRHSSVLKRVTVAQLRRSWPLCCRARRGRRCRHEPLQRHAARLATSRRPSTKIR